jgi:hypothetical protein
VTSRYDDLGPRALWFLQNFDELDLADICASNEAAAERTQAALIRDQAALAQVRLLIGAYRPRLKLADPVLLARLDRVLEQPAELEPAAGERRWPIEKEGS